MRKLKFLTRVCYFCVFALLSSCFGNKIETDKTLKPTEKAFIQSLNLLEKDEPIYKFYSEFKNEVAGNFFTDRRMAKYWIDERDKSKNKIEFAYYPEIIAIDTVYYAGATYCPYMLVKKKDSTEFKLCVDGKREEITAFFEDAMQLWRQKKMQSDVNCSQHRICKKAASSYLSTGNKNQQQNVSEAAKHRMPLLHKYVLR
jgi:hypothetical protein